MTTYDKIIANTNFEVPENWLKIRTIDMHTGGEPLRVIVDGFPELPDKNVLASRRFVKEDYDHLRQSLMFEPRGHADMYGCLLLPPDTADADFGILFMHNEGYSTMCGHAIIAISTLAVIMNWIDVTEGDNLLKIDAPCGRINSYARVENGKVVGVRFEGVPSFVVALNSTISLPGIGKINYDLAYGGAFYAYVDASQLDLVLLPENYAKIINSGMAIKRAVMENNKDIVHPFEPDLSFLYGTIFIGGPVSAGQDSRNVCVFAEGEVDRSPTGSGVSGRMAIHHAREELNVGEILKIESITGSVFTGKVLKEVDFGPFSAVIPEVEGTAYITGMNTFVIDPDDPMQEGFILR